MDYDSEEPDYSGWSSQTSDTVTVTSNADVSFSTVIFLQLQIHVDLRTIQSQSMSYRLIFHSF